MRQIYPDTFTECIRSCIQIPLPNFLTPRGRTGQKIFYPCSALVSVHIISQFSDYTPPKNLSFSKLSVIWQYKQNPKSKNSSNFEIPSTLILLKLCPTIVISLMLTNKKGKIKQRKPPVLGLGKKNTHWPSLHIYIIN